MPMSKIKDYKPLPEYVTIGKSKLHGLGLIALKNIDDSFDLGITHVVVNALDEEAIRTPLGGFINHSYQPNCKMVKDKDTF